ncbi:hypothetical protein GGX14DRAFT_516928 [Mycena pura]|uniref:Arrestin C-terminal-like domain-containing protein n=1 Tax=Mycena pura TaxID=153505 RepID=A0AAD6VMQ0_9AGAR|nr:hypothetical protein GGX14DRAFT_516928 [Mycena pura]
MRDKERLQGLDIHLDNSYVCLKGTGNDFEPACLTGHVALYLAESTPIKEITLQFRGKARLPPSQHDSPMHLSSSVSTYIICNHDWSFLEGEKKHSHTLKAGHHFFPFQLQIGSSLPSSVSTGGASVAYKLRAQAGRPGLNSNLQAVCPVHILRAFSSEALEYQQTHEIENTWPDKLMYSVMIPHKAWAVTDTLTALVKFSPLVKGVGVVTVETAIHETTKVHQRSTMQEHTRVVASVTHEIIEGTAVEVAERPRWMTSRTHSAASTSTTTPAHHTNGGGDYFSFTSAASPETNLDAEAGPSLAPFLNPEDPLEQGQDDVVTYLSLTIPPTVVPTHSLEPIAVSHRLRWKILIINPDGHTSELRCSLPLHLLDQRLLKEARACTSATRRLVMGGTEVPNEQEVVELPSYKAHVRDRVANMFLPEAATMRVTNPWLSPSSTPPALHTSSLAGRVGQTSPAPHLLPHLPHAPGSGDSQLDWVNSELLLSMGTQTGTPPLESHHPSSLRGLSSSLNYDSNPASRAGSRPSSNWPSRLASRAPSPERRHSDAESIASIPVAGPSETYVHSSNASRSLHGIYTVAMKPFTVLAHPHWPGMSARSASHTSLSSLTSVAAEPPQPSHSVTLPDSSMSLLQRAYTAVPDYNAAAHGFIGGVPPLSSLQGLPSYEEAESSQSAAAAPSVH